MTPLHPTTPEPSIDIECQLAALLDPLHPKRALWVSRGTRLPSWLPAVPRVELPAGVLFATTDLCRRLQRSPCEEELAAILDYVEPKSALYGLQPIMVQARIGQAVVHEMAVSWSRLEEAISRARAYACDKSVVTLSLAQCLERRARLR